MQTTQTSKSTETACRRLVGCRSQAERKDFMAAQLGRTYPKVMSVSGNLAEVVAAKHSNCAK